jgi:hypothetical protein
LSIDTSDKRGCCRKANKNGGTDANAKITAGAKSSPC